MSFIPANESAQPAADQRTPEPTLGFLPFLTATAVSLAVSGPALAQQQAQEGEAATLGTVTVTGERDGYNASEGAAATLTAPLLDTPRTIRIITQREMEERGATSVEDVLRTTPGITLGSGEGGTPFGTRPYIRGFEAAFSMAVDGVRTRGRTTYESFNLENIEVNMGSDGVTAGAGAAAGSINLNSKEPRPGEDFHHVSATFGNASQRRVTYDGNLSFAGGLTGRLNLLWQDSGVPGSRYVEDDKRGIAPALSWRFGDSKLTFKAQHVKSSGRPGARMPFANAAWNNNASLPGWADYGSGTPEDPYRPIESVNRNNYYGVLARDFREAHTSSAQLRFEHAFANRFSLTSNLSWIETDVKMGIMRPAVSVVNGQFVVGRNGGGGMRYSNRGTDTATFNTSVHGKFSLGGFEHSIAVGGEVARDRVRNGATPTAVAAPNQTPLLDPNPRDPFTVTGSWGPLGTPVTTETKALYAFDTVTLSKHWMLNGGLRVEDFKIDDGTRKWSDVLKDYQFGVMYKPASNMTVYASVNTTSSPPGACANQGGGNCPSESLNEFTTSTKAEKTRNLELGVKWDLYGGDLSLAAAVFNTAKKNARVADENGDYTLNAGNSRGRGFDLSVAGRVTKRWSVMAGYTFLDAKVVDGGPNRDEAHNGKRPINTAKHTFALWTTYHFDDRLTFGGGANYVSQKYVNPENTYAVPAYWRVDAMVSYQITKQAALQVNVTNLLNKTYFDSSHVGQFATLQPGRGITAKLSYSF